MTGRHRVTPVPEITAGEPEHGLWCQVCQDATRVRVPLFADGVPAGGIEFCPGCGTGHDKPGVYAVPQMPVIPATRYARDTGPWLPRLARSLHRRACKRSGMIATECAYGQCRWPGLWRNVLEVPGDEGTWRYVFCRASHRELWAAGNGIMA